MKYLNDTLKTNFRNPQHLPARIAEGYKYEDFVAVIDKKFKEWGTDKKMCKYLRPVTLFAKSKFDGYVNEVDEDEMRRLAELRVEKKLKDLFGISDD